MWQSVKDTTKDKLVEDDDVIQLIGKDRIRIAIQCKKFNEWFFY